MLATSRMKCVRRMCRMLLAATNGARAEISRRRLCCSECCANCRNHLACTTRVVRILNGWSCCRTEKTRAVSELMCWQCIRLCPSGTVCVWIQSIHKNEPPSNIAIPFHSYRLGESMSKLVQNCYLKKRFLRFVDSVGAWRQLMVNHNGHTIIIWIKATGTNGTGSTLPALCSAVRHDEQTDNLVASNWSSRSCSTAASQS